MEERRGGFWRDIRDIVVAVAVLMLIYSVGIFYFFRGEFIGWLNTLFATLISVVFALVVGLILYHYQDRRADQGKKESLSRLLKAELTEVRNLIQNEKTVVPDDALKAATRRTPGQLETRVSLHYVHPLIVEEAIRSGLFNERKEARTPLQNSVFGLLYGAPDGGDALPRAQHARAQLTG